LHAHTVTHKLRIIGMKVSATSSKCLIESLDNSGTNLAGHSFNSYSTLVCEWTENFVMKIIKNSGKLSFRELQIITISNLMLSKLLKKWTEGF